MRRLVLLVLLLATGFLAGCGDVAGIGGGRSLDGDWAGTVDREDVYLTLREDNGTVRGSGYWGPDRVTVYGDRRGADVSFVVEFHGFDPATFEGVVSGDELDGWLTGSGWYSEPVLFWRD